jgi:hypothetical protein
VVVLSKDWGGLGSTVVTKSLKTLFASPRALSNTRDQSEHDFQHLTHISLK